MHRESASAGAAQSTRTRRRATGAGVGASPPRPDGGLKVTGKFAYSSDLYLDNMLWGATVRSPHPRARVIGIDVSEALTLGGVATVLTSEDVPGNKLYGMKVADQPDASGDEGAADRA